MHKTAYEMRISDWSSDGCSSDLHRPRPRSEQGRFFLRHDPEAQAAVGAWNVDAVSQLGSFIAGAALGADRKAGLAAINRAVVLGGDRAMFPGLAALLRLSLNSKDVHARGLAEAAARGTVPTALDQAKIGRAHV